MILKISQKTNTNGWRQQAIINFDEKTITKGAFLFVSGDIDDLTASQFKQMLYYFTCQGFKTK